MHFRFEKSARFRIFSSLSFFLFLVLLIPSLDFFILLFGVAGEGGNIGGSIAACGAGMVKLKGVMGGGALIVIKRT